jgi:hypothetical protein
LGATTATAHKLARMVYGLMRDGEAYVKETEQQEVENVRQRLVKQLHRRARELGFELTRKEPDTEPTRLVEA